MIVVAYYQVSDMPSEIRSIPTRVLAQLGSPARESAMRMDLLTNPTVKAGIEALQSGDKEAWSALFTPDATMLDDGHPRSFKGFTKDALGHERFTFIDSVENNGLNLVGAFHSDTWGDFRTYFRFHLTAEGKISRLDVGQAH